jgi:hypothetical protein
MIQSIHKKKQRLLKMPPVKNDLPAPDSLTFIEPWPEGV